MTFPRLLSQLDPYASTAVDLANHRRVMPCPPAPLSRPHQSLIAAVREAGLRGRGGGAFPTGQKMLTVASNPGRPVVVVNASEGEPASSKDRLLLIRLPHLVLDGALAAAAAVAADEVLIGVERRASRSLYAVHHAIDERRQQGELAVPVSVVELPTRFVAGEESALVQLINGGEARPTGPRQRVFVRGVDGRPTMVSNAETYAHLAQIVHYGPGWFRERGSAEEPGTMLVTLSGDVVHPGVCEIDCATPLSDVIALGSGTNDQLQALLVGGYYGAWIGVGDIATGLMSNASLRPVGAGVGCGALIALPAASCGLIETAQVLQWMASESAGQCGPCVNGLPALARAMSDLAHGHGDRSTVANLQRWASMIDRRGACTLPDGAARLVRSTLRVFAADVEHHATHGTCHRVHNPPVLHIPAAEVAWR